MKSLPTGRRKTLSLGGTRNGRARSGGSRPTWRSCRRYCGRRNQMSTAQRTLIVCWSLVRELDAPRKVAVAVARQVDHWRSLLSRHKRPRTQQLERPEPNPASRPWNASPICPRRPALAHSFGLQLFRDNEQIKTFEPRVPAREPYVARHIAELRKVIMLQHIK